MKAGDFFWEDIMINKDNKVKKSKLLWRVDAADEHTVLAHKVLDREEKKVFKQDQIRFDNYIEM